jgi:hypothetical protein
MACRADGPQLASADMVVKVSLAGVMLLSVGTTSMVFDAGRTA